MSQASEGSLGESLWRKVTSQAEAEGVMKVRQEG